MSALVATFLVASASAWAQDATQATPVTNQTAAPDWSALDADVERAIKAYEVGNDFLVKKLLPPLAERSHPKAMNFLGLVYEGSGHGLFFNDDPRMYNHRDPDYAARTACDWFEKAAKAGYVAGMYNLSRCFSHGKGRPKDQDMMLHWRMLAANHGHISAMINLAVNDYERGKEYRRWMIVAAEHGSRFALVALYLDGYPKDALDRGMTFGDFLCVTWKVRLMKGTFLDCD